MSTEAPRPRSEFSSFEQLRMARDVLRAEAQAILRLADNVQDEFCRAVELLSACQRSVIVTGMGKAGLVGQKIAATMASTGTSSHFVHPAEAVHGDLGRIHPLDVVLALSLSGETEEITRLLISLDEMKTPMVAITSRLESTLGRAADVTLPLGPLQEACSLGLAPTTSTTAMMAIGDALAVVLSRLKGFAPEDFARFHPGGSLGRKLSRVDDMMRPLADCRVAEHTRTVRDVLVSVSRPGRRTGAIMLVDARGCLTGLFTDSDLARMLEHKQESVLDDCIDQLMTREPTTVASGTFLAQAIELMAEKKISELPVVDQRQKPLGLIDITDLLAQDETAATCFRGQQSDSSANAASWRLRTLRFPTN